RGRWQTPWGSKGGRCARRLPVARPCQNAPVRGRGKMQLKPADGTTGSGPGSLSGTTVIATGKRPNGLPGATWKTSGTFSTGSDGQHGNVQGATRPLAACRR